MDLYRGAGGPEARTKALHYGVMVADRALAGLAWESAAALAGELLQEAGDESAGSRPEGPSLSRLRVSDAALVAELRRIRGVALFRLGRRGDGMREIEEAAAWYRHHGDRDGIARLLREPLFFQVGELEMRDLFYEAREMLGPEHPQSFWARVGSIYARYQVDGDYHTALEETNALIREFAGSGRGPQEAETLLYSMRAYIQIKLRHLDKASADLARVSGAGVSNKPRLEVRTTVPRIALYLRYGRSEAAERAARNVAEAVERSGDYSYIGRFYAFLLRILLRRGAWEEIEQIARRVREVDPAEPLGYSIPILARYHRGAVEAGDLLRDRLRRLAAEEDLERGHTTVELALVNAFRAYVLESFDVEALEPVDQTRRSLRTLLSLDESHPVVRIRAAFALSELLYVEWLQGRAPPARDLQAAETALDLNNRIWLLHDQYAHFAQGLLHLVTDAPRRADRALRSAAAVAYRQDDYVTAAWIAVTRARHAHRLAGSDAFLVGGRLEQEAAGIASRLGMKPLLDHLSGASLLSPRERNVLQAVADGKSNKEIAAELKISNYTVINHMRHIMRKLGSSSRTEAVAMARRRGILPQ
jgi:DNA-binding CsgD family transcriptional regulator/tetratricopeptide (TPR) repeat protein